MIERKRIKATSNPYLIIRTRPATEAFRPDPRCGTKGLCQIESPSIQIFLDIINTYDGMETNYIAVKEPQSQ